MLDVWTIFFNNLDVQENLDVQVFPFLKTWTSSFSKLRKPGRPIFKSRVSLFTSTFYNFSNVLFSNFLFLFCLFVCLCSSFASTTHVGRSCAPRVTYAMDLQDLQNIFTEEDVSDYKKEDEDQDISDLLSDDGFTPDLNSIVDGLTQITPESQMSPVQSAVVADEVEVELLSQEFPPPRAAISPREAFSPQLQLPQTLPPLPQQACYTSPAEYEYPVRNVHPPVTV